MVPVEQRPAHRYIGKYKIKGFSSPISVIEILASLPESEQQKRMGNAKHIKELIRLQNDNRESLINYREANPEIMDDPILEFLYRESLRSREQDNF